LKDKDLLERTKRYALNIIKLVSGNFYHYRQKIQIKFPHSEFRIPNSIEGALSE
jgi:hypothetical protein